MLGGAVAAVLATAGGLGGAGAAIADDAAAAGDDAVAAQSVTEEQTTAVVDETADAAVEEPATEEAPAEEAPADAPAEEPEEEAPAEEPAAEEPAAEKAVAPAAKAGAKKPKAVEEEAAAADEPIVIMADTEGPGPDRNDLSVMFRAAHPDTYTTENPGTADTSNVQTQLTAQTQNRFFECGDTIVYYQIIEVGGDATGESVLEVTTDFDTRFGGNDQVGITEVTAFLAFEDSGYVSDGEETITGTSVSGTWSDGQIELTSTVTDVEAGETIVIEYHATLNCGNPPGTITGNLHVGSGGMVIIQNAGEGPAASVPGAGTQTVPLFANAVRVTVVPTNPTVTQGVCPEDGGPLVAPTLTVPDDTASIDYSVDPPGPYAPGDTVTVTADLTSGNVTWPDPLPAGWVSVDDDTISFTVTFDEVPCVPAVPVVTQGECPEDGAVVAPTLMVPDDTATIDYSVDVPGPYVGGQTVVVTAELLVEGTVWPDPLPAGWMLEDDGTITFTVTFDELPCVPAVPTVTQGECPEGGEPVLPTLTVPDDTAAIDYSVDLEAPYAPGETVVVTAELLVQGTVWPEELPVGWELQEDGTIAFTVTFDEVPCVPVAPVVIQPTCPEGVPTEPMLELPADTDAIFYFVISEDEDSFGFGETVVVVAMLEPGYVWAEELPEGWEIVDDMTAAFEVTFAEAPCIVAPVAPTVTPSVCPPGSASPTAPTLTLATTTGVTYTVSPAGPYSGGQTVTVTAVLEEGYAWQMPLPAGWTLNSPATFTVTFPAHAVCPKAPVKTPPKQPELPRTGADGIGTYVGLAGLALLAGAGLLWASRRRGTLG
ncbi:LPXTG-motif cell wall-anchored protein [Isoptericola variabilis J7]|uniref:LPXTG-motif cell wall anchor domain protein n=1 Tax=Isoptericola variabilis (strain 225) TaxID=743718 RepID=F6FVN8_ISOV2|nr:LPXTG-motif cell wall anchor domain protein [Isoptericola variabilis 225]TWH28229.1 LPXTG-motif cell wall-anchored protein [Isoptericola variabilis J7]